MIIRYPVLYLIGLGIIVLFNIIMTLEAYDE